MEDLVYKEAADRVEAAMKLNNVSVHAPTDAGSAREVFSTYLMTYLGADFTNSTPESLPVDRSRFEKRSSEWDTAHGWILDVFDKHASVRAGRGVDKSTLVSMA